MLNAPERIWIVRLKKMQYIHVIILIINDSGGCSHIDARLIDIFDDTTVSAQSHFVSDFNTINHDRACADKTV